ncbi:MAG: hypothetical protein E6Q97_31175 [Desulfurellales bacterium]|nr:MAG: hypothetical protein E6Q97_31175 [Desulfurellales bacterium]
MLKCSEEEATKHARWLCQNDLYFLLAFYLRRPDCENDWVFDRCREVQAEPNECIDLWFRGGYKSTIITFALTIQDILRDPEVTFGIFSFSRPIAKQFLRQIKLEFEQNGPLNKLFPDILWGGKPPPHIKWSEDDGIVVRRKGNPKESTVEAWGLIDGMPTSKHFKRLVYDDVVTDSSVGTPEQIKKVTERWGLSRNLVSKNAHSRVIGTRYHYFDSYADIMKRGFRVRKYAATKDGTVDGEPWIHTREELAKKRLEMQEQFSPQMMQEPRLAKDAYYQPAWWRRWTSPPAYGRVYIGCDFATKKDETADFTVFVVVVVDPADRWFIVDMYRDRDTPDVWVDRLIDLASYWQPLMVGVPEDQIKKSVGPFLRKRMLERKTYFGIHELPDAGADKLMKGRSFQGRAAQGMIYLPSLEIPPEAPDYVVPSWAADAEIELGMFPMAQHDDVHDALGVLGRMLDEIVHGQVPQEEKKVDPDDYLGESANYSVEEDPMLA